MDLLDVEVSLEHMYS